MLIFSSAVRSKYPVSRKLLVVCLLLSGCANDSQMRRPEHLSLPLASTMEAEVRLTQHQILVSHANSTAGGAAGLQAAASPSVAAGGFAAGAAAGLIGALVDAAIDAHRDSVAEEAAKPMREHMAGLDVDDLICQSMDGLDKHVFAETIALQRISRSEDDDKKDRQLMAGNNILVLAPSYSVSYDGKAFTYVLSAKIVDRGMNPNGFIVSKPSYQQIFEYVMAQENLPNGAQWGTLTAEQWKTLLIQASAETVAMLNYDIGAIPPTAREKLKYGHVPVSLDVTKGDRSWIRTNFGLMLSVSSSGLSKASS